ncbi:unnamed protein product [Parnassius mnemosyne]|uniref:Gag-pol polyprotein n=1 Tax=Parnassius mnemosyne TaxID=213953 RepID=A0AAV1KQU3_9NEOP
MSSDEANEKPTPLESQELRELKKKRKSYRGKLTMYCNFVKKFREINVEKLSASQILDLQLRTEAVGSIYNILDTIQERIDVLCTDIDEQLADRQKYDDAYFENVAHAKLMINSKQSGHAPNQVQVVNVQNKPETQDIIRYPEISLPSFSGGMNDWLEFRETFDSLINQSQMNSIQKYKYLRSCLQGGALEVVSSLEFTSENYSLAWNLLCERYNNPRLLINKHLKGLFNMETISFQASSLRSVIDNISKHLRSLKSLSIPVSEWDLVIIHFISSKLPLSIQRKWEERISSKELPSLQEFKDFLRSRADLLEVSHSDEVSSDSRDKRSLVATSSSVTPRPEKQNLHQCPQCKDVPGILEKMVT